MRTRYRHGDGTVEQARRLRRESTPAEDALWAMLRGSRLDGWKFRRQQRFAPYTVDFVCHAARLIVEVDGASHAGAEKRDARRTAHLESLGYRVIRFWNNDVMTNPAGVYDAILAALSSPLPSGERGKPAQQARGEGLGRPSPSHSAAPSGPLPLPRGERDQ